MFSMLELHYYSESGRPVKYHHEEDAGLDLPIWDARLSNGEFSNTGSITLAPGESATLKTGVHLGIPQGHYGLLDSRSSTSKLKLDLLCHTIDSPFRGNIRVAFINNGTEPVTISHGDELFQIIIKKYEKANTIGHSSYEEFLIAAGETTRGEEGFGSKERNQKGE